MIGSPTNLTKQQTVFRLPQIQSQTKMTKNPKIREANQQPVASNQQPLYSIRQLSYKKSNIPSNKYIGENMNSKHCLTTKHIKNNHTESYTPQTVTQQNIIADIASQRVGGNNNNVKVNYTAHSQALQELFQSQKRYKHPSITLRKESYKKSCFNKKQSIFQKEEGDNEYQEDHNQQSKLRAEHHLESIIHHSQPNLQQQVQEQQAESTNLQNTLKKLQRGSKLQSLEFDCKKRESLQRNSLLSLSDESYAEHDEYNIWDNKELHVRGVNIEDLQKVEKTERQQLIYYYQLRILKLYKIRYGQFPLQREPISNDKVIRSVKKIASTNSNVYKKYFSSRKVQTQYNQFVKPVNFNDYEDYSTSVQYALRNANN